MGSNNDCDSKNEHKQVDINIYKTCKQEYADEY